MDLAQLLNSAGPSRHAGQIEVAWSDNRHAYGIIPVPVTVLTGGAGPTALLVAGTHGDEYEGQLALHRIVRELDPGAITGRLIVLPALNTPAVRAATRVSPVDGINLNRAYPGKANGSPTLQIAHVVAQELLPVADYALDLHSGGSSAFYLPSAYIYEGPSASRFRAKRDAAETLGLPWSIRVTPQNGSRTFSGLAEELGICTISTEIAGGGMVTPRLTEQLFSGLLRLLHSWGVLRTSQADPEVGRTRWLQMQPGSTVYAQTRGIFERASSVNLGDEVAAGECAGRIHSLDDIGSPPVEVISPRSGIVGIVRRPPLVERGDGLFTLMADITEEIRALR